MLALLVLAVAGLLARSSVAVELATLAVTNATAPPAPEPLRASDLVFVYTTTTSRLPLVHATRPARAGIRTVIAVQNASEAYRLNGLHGGPHSAHLETYVAFADAEPDTSGIGPYGRDAPSPTHPLHLAGPRFAVVPLLAHEVLMAAAVRTAAAARTAAGVVLPADVHPAPPPPPYRWMLLGRDDTLWLPAHAVRLLAPYDAGEAAAVSDHLVDFNGHTVLSPSPAAASCLPCGLNLTALLGRRRPPRVPPPACPVCRPAAGCEYRFDLCEGLVGGPFCGSRRFLGSGERCLPSWAAGGAGLALSSTLVNYLPKERWISCVREAQPSTGERAVGRCLFRNGFAYTHPAAGLAAGLTREVFSARHLLFGNPLARQAVFGGEADAALGPAYAAAEAAARAAAAAAPGAQAAGAFAFAEMLPGAGAPPSTRLLPAGSPPCDAACMAWVGRHAVTAHLDVPYGAGGGAEVVAAAAAVMEAAARRVAAMADRRR